MRGWEFVYTNKPLRLVLKPDPSPKPGFVVIDVKACGLCHTDVSIMEHESWLKLVRVPPLCLGHEFAGVISAVGEGVTDFKVGDRVGACPMLGSDGTGPGFGRDGGYATKATSPVEMLVRIPDNVSFVDAAAATDAGMTGYHAAVANGGLKPGMKVGVIGIGGIAQFAVRAAVLRGCDVYAASRKAEARDIAMGLGCKAAVENIMELRKERLDVIIDCAGAGVTTEEALQAVKFRGRVVVVGMAEDYANINTMNLITKQLTLIGSNGGTIEDIAACYEMMASGQMAPVLTEIPFSDIDKGLETLKAGQVRGRLVAVMPEE